MKGTRHNGRSGKNGVYNPLHNDRRFNPEHSEHIDNERVRQNIYWDCYQGYTTMEDQGKENNFSFEQIELAFYEEHYGNYVMKQNKRHVKARHPDRCKEVEDVWKNKKTCPEESIYQLGTIDEHASVETLTLRFYPLNGDMDFSEVFGVITRDMRDSVCVSYVTRTENFDCGIMISASHNPFYDNGIKVINGKGHKLEAEVEAKIEAYIDGEIDELPLAKKEDIGRTVDYAAGRNRYIGYLISLATRSFEDMKIGLDCSNGSAFMIAKSVYDALGAKTYVINCEPDGTNINTNCGSTHIEVLQQ